MTNLLIHILAAWRLTSLLMQERGPFNMFGVLRRHAGIRYDAYSKAVAENEIAKMLLCHRCTSIWAGLAVLLVPGWLRKTLAVSAGAIILKGVLSRARIN